jgi:uncharacterized membrane protein YbaN (DUF454 family)
MKYIRRSANWLFILIFLILGFIGLALPLAPQIIFFAIAIIILSFEVPALGNFLEKKLPKNSKAGRLYHIHRSNFEKYFK